TSRVINMEFGQVHRTTVRSAFGSAFAFAVVVIAAMAMYTPSPAHAAITTMTSGSSGSIIVGQQATLGASISIALANYPPPALPTGTLQFFEGATPVGSALTVSGAILCGGPAPPCSD